MLHHFGQTTDTLFYEVLDLPLPQLERLKTLKASLLARLPCQLGSCGGAVMQEREEGLAKNERGCCLVAAVMYCVKPTCITLLHCASTTNQND